jgi:hypothetical protein
VGLDNVPNVGWVSFFLRVEEKNKINSFKFALSYQKAKSCLFLIKRYRIYLVVCRSYTCCQQLIYACEERILLTFLILLLKLFVFILSTVLAIPRQYLLNDEE